jgi:hypothetical protein
MCKGVLISGQDDVFMKILDDLWSSVSGAAKVRVNDPFIGTFTISWLICNWNQVGLLLWGEGKPSERINSFYLYLTTTDFFAFNAIFFSPLVFTLFYLFIFPWVSLFFKACIQVVNGKLYKQAINVELYRVRQQGDLNKARLLSDPDKQFIEQSVQWDLDRKSEILKHMKDRGGRLKSKAVEQGHKAAEAEAIAAEAKSRANIAQHDEEHKKNQTELERQRFNVNSSKLRAAAASHRFPSAYFFIAKLDEILRLDDLQLSLAGLGAVVAAIFGYEDFQGVLDDEGFNNDALSRVEYVYYDSELLAARLEAVISDEPLSGIDLTSEILFDYIILMFDGLPYCFVDLDGLEEKCVEFFEEHSYSMLNHEGVSGAMAESDTIFDEVTLDSMNTVAFDRGFSAKLQADARGSHRRDSSVSGRTMTIEIEITSRLQVGKRALGTFEFHDIHGSLDDMFEPEEMDAEGL